MGRIVKQVNANTTKYYWYPGDKSDWIRAGVAVGIGALAFGLLAVITRSTLWAAVAGTSVTAAIAGLNFGRRDARALHTFPDLASARKAAIADTGRAAWRGMVQGFGGAAAAVLIANMSAKGFVADWMLPVVPAIVGALAHQAGMLSERMAQQAAAAAAAEAAAADLPQPAASTSG